MVAAETVAGAAAGLLLFHDSPRPGWVAAAVVGFLAALGGALALARYGEPAVGPVRGAGPTGAVGLQTSA